MIAWKSPQLQVPKNIGFRAWPKDTKVSAMLKGTAWGLPSERGERLGFLRVELLSMRRRFGTILGYITN